MGDESQHERPTEGEDRFAALVEEFLAELNRPQGDPSALRLRLLAENADIAEELKNRFRIIQIVHRSFVHDHIDRADSADGSTRTIITDEVTAVQCPQCGTQFRLLSKRILEAKCNSCGSIVDVSKPGEFAVAPLRLPEIGNFRILGLIGQGGFGAAYRAVDARLGRIVAIKLPRAGRFLSLNERERFIREAKAAARLRHPNIVQVHEISTTGEQPYIVSDYIDGLNLAELVDGQMLQFTESARIIIEVAKAVEFAHQNGIIHRDLKPANILLDIKRNPFVTDFGLARSRDAELTVTQEGEILGTPAYMSPEQAAGFVSKVDARSDVYSLGVILYRLICGVLPFRGSQQMQLLQAIQDDPPTPRSIDHRVPPDLETIALKAMAKEPGRRYQAAQQLADDLQRWINFEPILARRIGSFGKLQRWRHRHPRIAALTMVIACLLLVNTVIATGWAIRESYLKRIAEGITVRAVAGERMSRHRLVKMHVQNGLNALENDRPGTSMVWFAQALADAAEDNGTSSDNSSRMRIAMARSGMPILTAVSSESDIPLSFSRIPQTSELLTGTTSGRVSSLNLETNQTSQAAWLHDAAVEGIRHSNDGTLSAFLLRNGTVVIRSSADGMIRQTISHPPLVADADFSPDGQLIATAGIDGTARVSSTTGRQDNVIFPQPLARCALVRFIDKDHLLAVSHDAEETKSRIQVQSITTDAVEENAAADPAHQTQNGGNPVGIDVVGRVFSVAFSSDGSRFAASTDKGTALLAETFTCKVLEKYDSSESPVECFLTKNDHILMVANNGGIQVRSISGIQSRSVRFPTLVSASTLDPSRRLLAVAGVDGQCAVYVASTLQRLTPLFGNTSSVRGLRFSEDGRRISLLTGDGIVRVWDLAGGIDGNPILEHDAPITVARFSPDGLLIATASADGTFRLWDAASGNPVGKPLKFDGIVVDCIFSPDGRYVAAGGVDGTSAIIDTSGQTVGSAQQHENPVQSLAFSPVENLLISGSRGGEVFARRVGENQHAFKLTHPSSVNSIRFTPDGRHFSLAGSDGTVTVWSADGSTASITVVHPQSVLKTEWSDNSSLLATVCDDKLLRVFSPATSTAPVRTIRPAGRTLAAAFTKEGALLTSGENGLVEHWTDVSRTWNYLREGFMFYHVELSPRQDIVAASGGRFFPSRDTGMQTAGAVLLDAETGLLLAPLLPHDADVRRCFFSPDQKSLLTGSRDGTARIWTLKSDLRSVSEIIDEVEVLSGLHLGSSLQLEHLAPNDVVRRFSRLRGASLDRFRPTPRQITAWEKHVDRLFKKSDSL